VRTNYHRGRDFEYRVKRELERMGWVVIRAAASRPVDLVAMRGGRILFIECKKDGRADPGQLERQRELARRAGAELVVVSRRGLRQFLRSLRQLPL